MMPIVDGLEEEFGGTVNFYRLNADERDVSELQSGYGLRGHPAFAVLDGEDAVMQTFVGPQEAAVLRQALAAAAEDI